MMVNIIKYGVRSNSFRYISNLLSVILFPGLIVAVIILLGLVNAADGIDLMAPLMTDLGGGDGDRKAFHFQSPLVYIKI